VVSWTDDTISFTLFKPGSSIAGRGGCTSQIDFEGLPGRAFLTTGGWFPLLPS
jgi:hypothetical protein